MSDVRQARERIKRADKRLRLEDISERDINLALEHVVQAKNQLEKSASEDT